MNQNKEIWGSPWLKVALIGNGCLIVVILTFNALRSSQHPQAPVTARNEGVPVPAAVIEKPPVSANPTETESVIITKLGQGKEKPLLARNGDSPLRDVKLAFKLDPRLTQSLYMGDRWVSPPTYFKTGEGKECTFEAMVRGVDTQGKPMDISATWIPADPEMVTISPGPGKGVQITVHHAGHTSLEVASLGLIKKLPLNALPYGNTLVVEVYQQ